MTSRSIFLTSAFVLCNLAGTGLYAQGITFEEGNWASVLAKAKSQNKLVYVDVYTTWCGPCKLLASNIFPKKEAGDYYNAHFVNYRIDAEKGEGLTIAQQYHVTGYPTHLFIDPANSNVVYRGMGFEPEVEKFVQEGELAGSEWKDPMTWDIYTSQFPSKKSDKTFLRAYLKKSERLNKDNAAILNAYVALLDRNHLPDSELLFLADNIRTIDNEAVPLVSQHASVIDKQYPDREHYLNSLQERWIYATYEKAEQTKDENLLPKIDAALKAYKPKDAEEQSLSLHARYYAASGDQQAALKAATAQANFLSAKTAAQYKAADEAAIGGIKEQLRWQLKSMNVPEAQWDEMIKKNFDTRPSISHTASVQAAQELNGAAWNIYEKHAGDPALVKTALGWSKKSLELSEASTDVWPAFADTYAHLLYVSGKKEDAIKQEQAALDKLKAANSGDVAQYEEELQKMKTGKL